MPYNLTGEDLAKLTVEQLLELSDANVEMSRKLDGEMERRRMVTPAEPVPAELVHEATGKLIAAAVDGLLVALEAEGVKISPVQRRRAVNGLLYGVPFSPAEEREERAICTGMASCPRHPNICVDHPYAGDWDRIERDRRLTDRIEPADWVREPPAST